MNAHVQIASVTATEAWFADLCDNRAELYRGRVLDLHEAVDELEAYARLTGLNRRIGRNMTQHLMAMAFGSPSIVPDVEQFNFEVGDIVRRWELADPRDRWKWTGEAPPPKVVRDSAIRANVRSIPQESAPLKIQPSDWLKLWKAKRC